MSMSILVAVVTCSEHVPERKCRALEKHEQHEQMTDERGHG